MLQNISIVNFHNSSGDSTNYVDQNGRLVVGATNAAYDVNGTISVDDGTGENDAGDGTMPLNELQLIKAVVLVVVVVILLLSTCKIVFKTFSKYTAKRDP